MVECVADSAFTVDSGNAKQLPLTGVLMRFRFEAIRNWKVAKAQLHLHLAKGTLPPNLEIALSPAAWKENQPVKLDMKKLQFLRHKTEGLPEGWFQVEVEPSLVEILASGKATTLVLRDHTSAGATRFIDARENAFAAAYLVVDGESSR